MPLREDSPGHSSLTSGSSAKATRGLWGQCSPVLPHRDTLLKKQWITCHSAAVLCSPVLLNLPVMLFLIPTPTQIPHLRVTCSLALEGSIHFWLHQVSYCPQGFALLYTMTLKLLAGPSSPTRIPHVWVARFIVECSKCQLNQCLLNKWMDYN